MRWRRRGARGAGGQGGGGPARRSQAAALAGTSSRAWAGEAKVRGLQQRVQVHCPLQQVCTVQQVGKLLFCSKVAFFVLLWGVAAPCRSCACALAWRGWLIWRVQISCNPCCGGMACILLYFPLPGMNFPLLGPLNAAATWPPAISTRSCSRSGGGSIGATLKLRQQQQGRSQQQEKRQEHAGAARNCMTFAMWQLKWRMRLTTASLPWQLETRLARAVCC